MVVFLALTISMVFFVGLGCAKPAKKKEGKGPSTPELAGMPGSTTPVSVTYTPSATRTATPLTASSKPQSNHGSVNNLKFDLKSNHTTSEANKTNLDTVDEENPLNDKRIQAKLRNGTNPSAEATQSNNTKDTVKTKGEPENEKGKDKEKEKDREKGRTKSDGQKPPSTYDRSVLIPFLFLTAILGSLSRESIISYKSPVNFTNETADTENVTEMNVETEAPFKSFRLRGAKTEFDKKYDVYLKNLGFYDNPIDVERGLPEFTLVTGFSENHAAEARHMAVNIARVFPGKKLYVYGFDLPEETARWFQKACNVVFRRANFSSYPNHVTHFKNYAFKPLIIAEALQELRAVLWVDTSTIFPGRNMSTFISQLNSLNVTKTEPKMFMLGKADHNIVVATQDDMYDYIPPFSNTTLTHRNMSEGGHTLLYRTKETMDLAFRWWVLCALEVDCIAPPGAKIPCDYDLTEHGTYGGCHRYDQSAVNLILDPYPKSFLSETLTIDFLRTQRDLGLSEDTVVDCSN